MLISCYIFRLYVTGFDTCLASKDDIKKMVRGLFPGCGGCYVRRGGFVLVYIRGQDDIDNALKLSGVSVRGFKIAVDTVLPIERVIVGTPASMLPSSFFSFSRKKTKAFTHSSVCLFQCICLLCLREIRRLSSLLTRNLSLSLSKYSLIMLSLVINYLSCNAPRTSSVMSCLDFKCYVFILVF